MCNQFGQNRQWYFYHHIKLNYCNNNVREVRSALKVARSLLHNAIMVRQSVDASIARKMLHLHSPIQHNKGVFLNKDAAVQSDCPYCLDPTVDAAVQSDCPYSLDPSSVNFLGL